MAEYLINFAGNCCELFIILFFLKDNYKLRVNKKIAIPLCGLFLLFQFVTNNLFLGKSVLVILSTILFLFFVSLIYEIKMSLRIVFSGFIYLLMALSEMIVGSTLSIIFKIEIAYMQNNLLIFAFCTLTSKFISYIFVLFTKAKRLNINNESFKLSFLSIFLLPIASVLIMFLFLRCCYQISDTGFYTITLITAIVLMFANIAIFYIIDKQNDLIKTKEKLLFTETHINSQIAHYEELYRHQTELRTFRHNIKNIFISLMGIIKEGDTEKTLYAMQSNLDILDEMNKNIVNTGHPITDAILQSKLHDADSKNIKLNISTKLTEKIIVDELELGIVLGNALDNAIEATEKVIEASEKTILFDMITTAERIIITIENPVDRNINPDKLTTTKMDKLNHGHGINSIKTIAKKYDGVAEFTCSDGKFVTNINIENKNINTIYFNS